MTNLYFIQAGINGPIKIGIAKDLRKRLSGVQVNNHEKVTLICFESGDKNKEKELHEKFIEYHTHGEWHIPGPKLLEYMAHMPQINLTLEKCIAEKHPFWKGSLASRNCKRDRTRRRFKITDEKCKYCDKKAIERYHLDGNIENMDITNVALVCRSCCMRLDGRTAKLANTKRCILPPSPCAICTELSKPLRQGRCHRCTEYFRRHKVERSVYLFRTKKCSNCKQTVKQFHSEGRCNACSRYFKRNGCERPKHLVDRSQTCKNCHKPTNPLRNERCVSCYRFLNLHGVDKNAFQ